MDTTRMPYAMHSWYLRELYLNNRLKDDDALEVAGQPIALSRIEQPLYAVAAEDDHIAPWHETFRIANLVTGPKRYVLSSSGHILGIRTRRYHLRSGPSGPVMPTGPNPPMPGTHVRHRRMAAGGKTGWPG